MAKRIAKGRSKEHVSIQHLRAPNFQTYVAEAAMGLDPSEVAAPVAEARELSDGEAKAEIKAFFDENHGEVLYPDEVADALRIEVDQAIRLCDDLSRDGEIAQAARS